MRLPSRIQKQFDKPHGAGASGLIVGLALAAAMLSPAAMAERRDRSGEEVVKAECAKCHTTGENGAPRIGDAKAWAPRASQGLTALTAHALTGIRNMPAHGGTPGTSDIEIERAIISMVNASGGNWVEPIGGSTPAVMRTGEQIVQKHCTECHKDGKDGAPKIGDRAAWSPRMRSGVDRLVASAVHGHGGMQPRGGVADLTDAELRGAVLYMFNYGVATTPLPATAKARDTADPFHKVISGADVYLGIMRADAMPSRKDAPSGKDYYHLNVSLIDAKSRGSIGNAQVELRVEDPAGSETKTLDPIVANNTTSYGAYFRMLRGNPYKITARIRRPGSGVEDEAQFQYRPGN
jgi:cytochrome c5